MSFADEFIDEMLTKQPRSDRDRQARDFLARITPRELHPIGCLCFQCDAALEADARDPRDLAADERAR